jgi:hypothetical protein
MCRAGFEPVIPAIKQPQTYELDRAATGIVMSFLQNIKVYATLSKINMLVFILAHPNKVPTLTSEFIFQYRLTPDDNGDGAIIIMIMIVIISQAK